MSLSAYINLKTCFVLIKLKNPTSTRTNPRLNLLNPESREVGGRKREMKLREEEEGEEEEDCNEIKENDTKKRGRKDTVLEALKQM